MRKLVLGSLAGLALIAGGAARAADMPAAPFVKAPPPPMIDWSGFYVGGHAGFAASSIPFTFTDDTGASEDLRFSPRSYIAGGQFGAQWQFDQWVMGFEGTWSGLGLSATSASTVTPGEFTSVKVNQLATATVRFGSTWDRALFYAKAGYAAAHVNIHSVDNAAGLIADATAWHGGWTAGAGVDYMLWDNLILGAEFDYYNFNFDNINGLYNDGATPFSVTATNGNIYAVMARVSYLFR
jgi:outer membrane immunogenic protein